MNLEQEAIHTEYIDNEDTELELEESEVFINEPQPYDPEKIRVDTNQFSVRNILDMIGDGEIDLAPDFQRSKVWTPRQKSRLIESVLLRIPLPAFYFSSDKKGRMQVVDGVQRLTTLNEFVRNKSGFPLVELEYLGQQLDGKSFSNLESEWIARINRTQLTVNIIDPQTPHRVKFDIFKRLNTGGSPLTSQEIRHCMSQARSRNLLKRIVESEEFKRALPDKIINHTRMANREMVLRAAAFRIQGYDITGENPYTQKKYKDYDSLDSFLNDITDAIDDSTIMPNYEFELLERALLRGIDNAYRLFQAHTFRKWPKDDNRIYPVNKSLFEIWTAILGDYDWNTLNPVKESIIKEFRKLCIKGSDFDKSISRATASSTSVTIKFNKTREILQQLGL